jgi:hypothetical protein
VNPKLWFETKKSFRNNSIYAIKFMGVVEKHPRFGENLSKRDEKHAK